MPRLTQRLDDRRDQKVAAQLYGVGDLWFVGHHERPLSNRVAQGLGRIDCARLTSREDEETADRRHVGSAKYRSGNETLPSVGMRGSQLQDIATLIVLEEIWSEPAPRLSMMPPSPNATCCTAASSDGMVKTVSPLQGSAIASAARAPWARSGSTRARDRL
jgi:hypothetical protein